VGDDRIGAGEVTSYLEYTTRYYASSSTTAGRASPLHCRSAPANWECSVVKRQVVARLIEEHLVLNYAHDHHLSLTSADRARVRDALRDPALLRSGKRSLVTQILLRELTVQKVEDAVAPESAKRGFAFHVVKFAIPIPGARGARAAYAQALDLATQGTPFPDGTVMRKEWEAPFRLPRQVREALDYAEPKQYVGPFRRNGTYLVVQLLSRGVHPYGAPARVELEARYFKAWLASRLAALHPRCFGDTGRQEPCPLLQ